MLNNQFSMINESVNAERLLRPANLHSIGYRADGLAMTNIPQDGISLQGGERFVIARLAQKVIHPGCIMTASRSKLKHG